MPFTISKQTVSFFILITAVIGLMVMVIVLISREQTLRAQQEEQQTAQSLRATPITGELDINGVLPQGSKVTITATQVGSTQPAQTVAVGVPAHDGESWSFSDAKAGVSYEIQATIILNGKTVAQSSPLSVTAPADEEILIFNVEPPTPEPTPNAIVSGNIIVNGYIPSGSTITVQGRELGSQTFVTIADGLPGEERQFLSYATALKGVTYEVAALLTDANGTNIGTSSTLIVTAPAMNESITINSTAQAPATPTPTATPIVATATPQPATPTPTPTATPTPITISGNIDFNGIAPPNSRIVIFQKVYNTQNYQVAVDNIEPVDGASWTWNNPQQSTWYDLIAVLKQRQSDGTDQDIATSAVSSVAAPASAVTLTVNSSFSLSAPPGPITVTCGSLSGTTWNASVSLGSVSNAGSYWMQIGTSNGGAELTNTTWNATNNSANQTLSQSLVNGTTYYVRYAYATVPNVQAGSSQFSPFTGTTQARCTN